MILRAPYDRPAVLAALAKTFREARSLVLPNAVEAREPAAAGLLRPFFVADRGRYDFAEIPEPRALKALAEALCGRALHHAATRLLRLNPGGYALFLDDHRARLPACVEVTVDLSERSAGPAVEYRSGAGRVLVPQLPGLVAVVERDAQTWRCDRYLPITAGEIPVLRVRSTYTFVD